MKRPENPDLHKPMDLTVDGREAYKVIVNYLEKHEMTDTGGCKAFYSPTTWKERGESYGDGSVLIVVHDGGDLAYLFNLVHDCVSYREIKQELDKAGFYPESMTCWATAIYKNEL
jgi:hypothetical protein